MDDTVLHAYGVDTEKGLACCMGDRALYARILRLYLADDSAARAAAAQEARDYRALFSHAHELKGASANAGLTEVQAAAAGLVEFLRGCPEPDEAETARLCAALASADRRAREGIRLSCAEE